MQHILKVTSHSGLSSVDNAVIQRYKIISTFFIKQSTQHNLTIHQPPLSTGRPTRRCYTRPGGCGVSLERRWTYTTTRTLATRTFRTTVTYQRPNSKPGSRSSQETKSDTDIEKSASYEDEKDLRDKQTEHSVNVHQLENYPRFIRRLALSLPPMRRPSRDDLLDVATNFWERLRIRFKWFTIRSFRKFNADDMSAFFTWFFLSQTVWILVGT